MDSRGPQVIDKNIVDLLGLIDDFELSWEDYFRALREAAVAARMSDSKYSSTDAEVITEELKRVKNVDKTTVFVTGERKKEVKDNKVNKDKVTNISKFIQKQTKSSGFIIPKNNLLGGSVQKPPEKEEPEVVREKNQSDSLLSILISIDKTVGSILKTLEKQFKFDKKSADDERKRSDAEKMSARERQMETKPDKGGVTTIIKAAEKALSPLQEVFSRIKNFLFWMVAAKAFKMFTEWFSDPQNRKNVIDIIMFLRDHWVLLVGSWLAFGTGIGRFITRFTIKLGIWTAKMAVIIAKKLIPLIGKLKLGGKGKLLGAVGLGLGALGASKILSPKPSPEEQSEAPSPDLEKPPSEPVQKFEKGGVVNPFGTGLLEDKKEKKSEIPLELLGSPLVTRFASPVAPILSLLSLKGAAEKIPSVLDKAKKSKKLKRVGAGAKEALKFGISPAYYIFNKFFANKKDKKKSSKIEGRFLGGITGAAGKALEYSPLGLMFKASKFGAENLGKAASGAAGMLGSGLELGKKGAAKALEYSPLGLMFKASKFGAENLGKAASGAGKMLGSGLELGKKGLGKVLEYSPIGLGLKGIKGAGKLAKKSLGGFGDVTKKVLKYTPLGLGLSAGKKGLETAGKLTSGIGKIAKKGVKNTLKIASLPFAASLKGLSGVSNVLKGGLLKDPKIQSQFDSVSKKVKETGVDKDPRFIQMGGLPGLSKMILEKTGPEVGKQAKTTKFEKGGLINTIDSKEGLPITGAGKDDTLIKAKTGDAVLTKKDQSVLSKAMTGAGIGGLFGGPLGALAGGAIGAGISKFTGQGKETTIAVKKGEAIVSPEEQQTIFDRFGIDIPAWLSKRKPQKIDSDKIKTKSGVNVFNQGGVVKGYFLGGIVDGIGKAVGGVTKAISNPIGTVSNLVGGAIGGPFGNVLSTVGNIAGNFINPLGPAAGLLGGVGNIAGGIGDTIGNIAGGIGDTIGNIAGGISNIAGGALSSVGGAALNTVLPGIAPVTQMLGSGLVDNIPGLSQIKDAIGGLTKNLFKQGKDIQEQKTLNATQGTQITQQSLKNTMQDGAISDLGQQLSQIAGALGAAGGGGGGAPGAGGEGEDSSGFFGKIGDGVDGFLGGAKETIGGIFGGVKDGLTGAATGLFDSLGKGAGLVGDGLKLGGEGVLKALEYSPMGLAIKAGNEGLNLTQNLMSQGQQKKVSDPAQTSKPSEQATTRHAELMQSTNPQRIADYDAKHGAGSYSKKLQEKLNKTYSSEAPQQQSQPQSNIVPTGKVVGREDLSPKAQEALARLDAQKAGKLQPDVKTTKKGGSPFGGMLSGMMGGLLGSGQKSMTVVDGNVGTPTAQEQKDIDNLAAKKAKLQQSQQNLMGLKSPAKPSQGDDALRAEYDKIHNDPHHPLFEKVVGDLFTDNHGMRFSDFKTFKSQQSQQTAVVDKKRDGGIIKGMSERDKKSLARMGFSQRQISRYINEEKQIGKTGNLPKATFEMFGGSGKIDLNKPMGSELNPRKRSINPETLEYSKPQKSTNPFKSLMGMVKENTGMNIPGGTADRQLTALQPGEYVVPKDSVDKVGKRVLDSMVRSTDSNSTIAKSGAMVGKKVKPYETGGKGGMMKLPPIKSGGSGGGDGDAGSGMKEVMFDPLCMNPSAVTERERIQDTYGIISAF